MENNKLIQELNKLKVHVVGINEWEGIKFKPKTLKLVDLAEVISILENKQPKKKTSEEKIVMPNPFVE